MAERQQKGKNIKSNHLSLSKLVKNEQGFAYIELVVSLSMLVAIIPSLFFVANTYQRELRRLNGQHRLQMEYTHFMIFVQNELKQGKDFHNEGNRLLFHLSSGDAVRYEWKDQQVIRSVKKKGASSFQGRTILAYHVYSIVFMPFENNVTMEIRFQDKVGGYLDLHTSITARE
jgi:hypothetical protein